MKIIALLLLLLSFSVHANTPYYEQVDCRTAPLACNIYMEARGEPLLGQLAVAFTTLNRLQHESFPKTLRAVVYEKGAFSWTKSSGSHIEVREKDQWDAAKLVAKFSYRLLATNPRLYRQMDPTKGGLFYHAAYVKPSWRNPRHITARIGGHTFYRRDLAGWPSDFDK